MFLHIAGGEIAFPNFKDFMNSDGPFQLSYPDANLQPTKFAINDEARNFPKEAIERLGEGQKAKEKADKTLKTISGPISNIGVQFKPKNHSTCTDFNTKAKAIWLCSSKQQRRLSREAL